MVLDVFRLRGVDGDDSPHRQQAVQQIHVAGPDVTLGLDQTSAVIPAMVVEQLSREHLGEAQHLGFGLIGGPIAVFSTMRQAVPCQPRQNAAVVHTAAALAAVRLEGLVNLVLEDQSGTGQHVGCVCRIAAGTKPEIEVDLCQELQGEAVLLLAVIALGALVLRIANAHQAAITSRHQLGDHGDCPLHHLFAILRAAGLAQCVKDARGQQESQSTVMLQFGPSVLRRDKLSAVAIGVVLRERVSRRGYLAAVLHVVDAVRAIPGELRSCQVETASRVGQ